MSARRSDAPPPFVLAVFRDLERRQFGVGYDDLLALRAALRTGFGLESNDAIVELCVTLWAKSPTEAAIVRTLFARHAVEPWNLAPEVEVTGAPTEPAAPVTPVTPVATPAVPAPVAVTEPVSGRGLPVLPSLATADRQIVLIPQFPLTSRMVAQAFRRLRRPVRTGPLTQLDIEATIARISCTGVATAPILIPARRNVAGLLLLIDRQGSMAPLHPYLDHLRDAIVDDAALESVTVAYFHDSPVARADRRVVRRLEGLFPVLDSVLPLIRPSLAGEVFSDPDLRDPIPLEQLVEDAGTVAGTVVISDAGAMRGGFDAIRNVTSVAFARAMRARQPIVWLNPVPRAQWRHTSASELARHVPMIALDRPGLHRAVDVLRGRPFPLERAA